MHGAAAGPGGIAGGNGADSRAGEAGGVARGSRATCRAAGPILNVKADCASREKDVNVKLEPLLSRCSHMIEA